MPVCHIMEHISSTISAAPLSALIVVLLTAFLFCSKFLLNFANQPKPNRPPGPKPWPIIGNMNLLRGAIPHKAFHEIANEYGPLALIKLGARPVVLVSSPETAREILKTHDSIFANRLKTAAGKHIGFDYTDMTWAPYGPYWRQARRIYNEILSNTKLDSFESIRAEERRALISRLYTRSRKPIILRDHLIHYTLSNISRPMMGGKYFSESSSQSSCVVSFKKLQDMLDRWLHLNGVINIGDWIPWLNFLDLQGYIREMKEVRKEFERFFNYVIDDHKSKMEGEAKDMVDILLKQVEDPNLEVKLDSTCVKGLLQDLLAGGTDTSTTTVEWAFHRLLKNPHIIKKATQELDRVIGRERWVEEKDYTQLPYIDAIIKETFRLHPVGTLLPPRLAAQDCNVAGFDISKGMVVLVNVYSIGRDPKHWDAPDEFIPERFFATDVDISSLNNFLLMPFGGGRRRCPGYALALRIVRATLANLLHGFNWSLPEGMKAEDVSMEELYGLVTRPKVSLSVIVEPRLPMHLYNNNQ